MIGLSYLNLICSLKPHKPGKDHIRPLRLVDHELNFLISFTDVANSVGDDIANFAQKLGQDESPQKSNLSGKLIRH